MDTPENNLLSLQINKEITNLYKDFLQILEYMRQQHDIMIKKLGANVQENYIKDIDYFNKDFYNYLRKITLDKGNDTNRSISSFLEYFDFHINTEKLKEAASKQKVVKRLVINNPLP